jgi:microcystin-dependent protein
MAQVGNKNIDNASGQVVRLDIQNTIKAVTTHNFGARNDAGTILPCEFLADDTTNKLLIRGSSGGDQANPNPTSGTAATFFEVGNLDEANLGLLPKSGGIMTGQLLGDDGSGSGSPAYAFDNDADTGMFRSGPNTIGFSTSGTARVSVSDAGLDVVNGLPIRLQDSSGAPFVSLKSPSSLSGNVALTLPSSITNGGFLQTDSSGNLSFQIVAGVPTGSVFCMAVATVPSGYLECNGAAVSRTTYAALFAIIGVNYGSGNGSSTFNLPDLRGEFVRGFDHGRGVDNNRSINDPQGSQFGQHNHNVSASSSSSVTDPGHKHTMNFNLGNLISSGGAFGMKDSGTADRMNTATTGISVSTTTSISQSNRGGTSNSSETRPRNIAMMYIIKV